MGTHEVGRRPFKPSMVARAYRIAALLNPVKSALIKDSQTIKEVVNRYESKSAIDRSRKLPGKYRGFRGVSAYRQLGYLGRRETTHSFALIRTNHGSWP